MKLKELRAKRNLTQQQVADHIGCSSVVYSRYENGVRQPSIEVLLRLADLFGVSVDALLGRPEERNGTLTEYEMDLLTAARNADERAREDALQMLISHAVTKVGQYHLCPMAIASKAAKSSTILRPLPYLLRSCGLAVLHRDNLNFRTVFKAEHNSAISEYRRTIQQVNPQSLVPGFQNEGLFFYRPNENP